MKNEQAQRRIIAAALFPVSSYTAVPSAYEQMLTDKYIEGALTIYQSVELLEEYYRQKMGDRKLQYHKNMGGGFLPLKVGAL